LGKKYHREKRRALKELSSLKEAFMRRGERGGSELIVSQGKGKKTFLTPTIKEAFLHSKISLGETLEVKETSSSPSYTGGGGVVFRNFPSLFLIRGTLERS